ncbi:ParB N-terminal domain-containing protein [Empedobacter sp.]|uniref:ParB N-terminal domain-containing protein n=1 Tax=Empedobacter sp. TaxID=1927715 RepID=UPI00289C821C|nr:ParB N-terminal domain-containing protein [Empedobacter sp.]
MTDRILKNPDMKVRQSETIIVKRSQIKFAPYNPKNHSKQAIDEIKRNFKNVAFLGGIVWNETTGNLIDGHKRLMALDVINRYDGSEDYEVKVEKIELDLKTEKEQNVFQTRSRTELDDELMRQLLHDIDYKNAGLDEFDLNYYGVPVPELENNSIANEIESLYEPVAEQKAFDAEVRKEAVKQAKEEIKEKAIEKAKDMTAYVMLSFDDHNAKAAFCQRFDINENENIVKGEEFSNKIERIY